MAHAWRGRAVQSYCTRVEALRDTFYPEFLPRTTYHAPTGQLGSLGFLTGKPRRSAPHPRWSAGLARTPQSDVGRTNTHVYRSSSKFIRSEASPAARGSVQPERGSIGGARRERGGRGASDGPITCPTHFPTLLANVAGVAPSARFPHRALAGGPDSPRVNPPLPTPRRARASLPPPSLRSAHAPPLFRIPGPAGPLVARRSPPLTRPRPCPPRHRCSPPSPRRTRRRSVRRPPLEPRARAPSRATNSAAPQRAHIPNLHSQLLCSLGLNLPPGSPGRAPIEFRSVGRDIQGDAQSQKPAPHIARL